MPTQSSFQAVDDELDPSSEAVIEPSSIGNAISAVDTIGFESHPER